MAAAVGPLGAGSTVNSEVFERRAPVWTYMKSKGLYVGGQVDGTIIVERTSENEHFYGVKKIRNKQILAGEFQPPMGSVAQLWGTLQAAEGKPCDESRPPRYGELSPLDYELTSKGN